MNITKLTSWKIMLSVSSLLDSIKGAGLDIDELFEKELFKTSFLLRTLVTLSFATLIHLYEFDLP
jgi:hypothetical protein